jgi:hypothetical protein
MNLNFNSHNSMLQMMGVRDSFLGPFFEFRPV